MTENLVIVESPAKAKTIEKFLGKEYVVKSCFGHIRDLSKKNFGIDVNNDYAPQYIIPADKKKTVTELKKYASEANTIWLASDEDREGEAIAWHLCEALGLSVEKAKRIVFHEITKTAILSAIKEPRHINIDLVYAQQARRILDRLVGFELSPLLWKKVRNALSAGRVQSVAVRLIVEREREIISFKSISQYRVTGIFKTADDKEFKAELSTKFSTKEEAFEFLRQCIKSEFKISDLVTQPAKKSPAPPFTTSTLQQEASRKLGYSVSQTMTIAQRLYESGKITYMRTDSVNLSDLAVGTTASEITNEFGKEYLHTRKYTTKSKGAQEAHEAIRPTYITDHKITGNNTEQRLYDLIWKRTIASQMSDAEFEKTTATIQISNSNHTFVATGEVLKFDGFLKVYIESTDEEKEEAAKEGLLPPMKINGKLTRNEINAIERFAYSPPRYTEASLVRKLEELGIGRPSTYAPIISAIQARGYTVKEDRQGKERSYSLISLKESKVTGEEKTEIFGNEKSKLFPTDIGMVVNDFLLEHFDNILDFNFTAKVEKEFDDIASGKLEWNKMIDEFYRPFHKKVESTVINSDKSKGERLLGDDPVTGKPVSVKIGRYGPIAQIGVNKEDEKPQFASLLKGQHLETITLAEALDLFKLPRNIGLYEGQDAVIGVGRFGPYVRHNSKFYSLKKTDDPLTITLERSIEIITEKNEKDKNRVLKVFEENSEIKILNGRWGPYISYNKLNYRLPKDIVPDSLTVADCLKIIEEAKPPKKKKSKY